MSDEPRAPNPLDALESLLRTGRHERPAKPPVAAPAPVPRKPDDTWPVAGPRSAPRPASPAEPPPFETFDPEQLAAAARDELTPQSPGGVGGGAPPPNAAASTPHTDSLDDTAPAAPRPAPAPGPAPPGLVDLVSRIDRSLAQVPAAALSQAPVTAAKGAAAGAERHIVFVLSGTRYAVPMKNVLEIGRLSMLTPVPHTPEWMLGVTNVRGEIVSVTDLRLFLGLPRLPRVESSPSLYVRSLSTGTTSIVLVDRVLGIARLAQGRVRQPAGELSGALTTYLGGVAEHEDALLAVLDLERLVSSEDFNVLSATPAGP